MVVDFREELQVTRSLDDNGKPCFIAWYDYVWTKEDLAIGKITEIEHEEKVSIGEICKKIDEFGGSDLTIKARIIHFLNNDCIFLEEEY